MPDKVVVLQLQGSIAFNGGVNAKFLPLVVGVHLAGIAPLGWNTKTRRVGASLAAADMAGVIASSTGRANAAPTPRRNVRRPNAFLVIIISLQPSSFETVRFPLRLQ